VDYVPAKIVKLIKKIHLKRFEFDTDQKSISSERELGNQ